MKQKKELSLYRIFKKILPLTYSASPVYLITTFVVGILHGFSHGFTTLMTQKLFDSISNVLGTNVALRSVFVALFFLAFALVLNQLLNGFHNVMSEDLANRIMRNMGSALHKKASKLETLLFEDTSNLDDINKAKEGVMNSTFFLFILFTLLTYYIPYILIMGVYLYSLKPILAISLLIIFIPVALTQFLRVKVFSKLADESAPLRREYEYYEKCIVDKEFFKETRMLGANSYFRDLYYKTINLYNNKMWRAEKKSGLAEMGMKAITLLGYIGVLFLFVNALLSGEISVGAFFAVFISIDMMFRVLEEIICSHIGRLSNNLGSIKNFVRFLELPERHGDYELDDKLHGISLKNVYFKYPNSDDYVLENINLEVLPGETIAIVGENGAGKSTLVKIMVGLYSPSKGLVEYGGMNIRKIKNTSLFSKISAVFQNFQRYKLSLANNVTISNLSVDEEVNYQRIDKSLEMVNLLVDLNKFTNSYETILSREFGGAELSGGEWQKISIARGIYKSHNTIILDEPTASIDPNEETRIYNTFSKMTENKTAIIVTHRLGSAKLADKIVVLDNGRILEFGTHKELIQNGSKYASMFNLQSSMYQFDNVLTQ
ncbi:MAG: ABC transporter ATP-binding protein [Halanaerobiales bacterium]|nr:ABC transporter ATP-binding protein [Halanaerobiales bacterium]